MRFPIALVALAAATMLPSSSQAQDTGAGFQSYLMQVRAAALRDGVSPRTLDTILPTLTFNPRVVELDRAQPGGTPSSQPSSASPPFAPYRARHVDAERISRGRTRYAEVRATADRVERERGVPAGILMAIWGHETNYGGYVGDFDLIRSLASLAYDGRRRELFEPELIATLRMVDRGVPRERLKGSWAGAFGYPQFLPSVYLRLAVDEDGDGLANIWSSRADTLASIANYLGNAGWKPGVPWGVAARVPAGLDRASLGSLGASPRCPRVHERHSRWRTMAEWRRLGVVPQGPRWPADDEMASLLEPDGPGNTAYLLTGNYRVILDYNCSNFYALSVGLLADEITR
ncbi:lytic murein transglycosylase [Sphingomonas jejuensis]|uniref:Lytic murein transglycosylase n=1 Tax=Sphingomonas jejuensis TaxID=904715 RepID=A0ABX0XLA8_9SPHN|nr:lytic murein transglycosylase [Sphingomonas jejuensis]